MDRAQKEAVVGELDQIFADSGVVVVAHYEGMSVADMTAFRSRMREAGGKVRVAKNKLAKIALKDHPAKDMADILTGMTVFAYADDPVSGAKAIEDFAKENSKLQIIGGILGPQVLDRDGVKAVSKMPSREEVIGSLVSMLFAPGQGIAGAVGAPASNIAGALGAPGGAIAGIVETIEKKAA